MKAEHFLINARFAKANNLPVSFNAIRIPGKETKKAVWVYGHGAMDPEGSCARCGKRLTHPGSILIGIGPECLGDWGARDVVLANLTEADKAKLQSFITERKVDCWIPKAIIKKATPINEEIHLPKGHKSLPAGLPKEVEKEDKLPDSGKVAKEWKGVIAIKFPYSYEMVTKIKTLDGRKYHPEGKYWTCPIKPHSVLKLKGWGFDLQGKALVNCVAEQLAGEIKEEANKDNTIVKEVRAGITGLKRQLFPYQEEGVLFIESRKGRALVGDEMGLGKTIQALAYLQLHPEYRPAVIVCPASLKYNWAKEIRNTITRGIKTQILEGKRPYKLHGEIVIINYDILHYWVKELIVFSPKIIIADEVHYIKSNSAQRTKALKILAKPVPHFIGLSGTPIVNRPIEIYNALSIINSSVIPSFWDYVKKYCGAVHNGYGWDFNGATNTDELHRILTGTIMIRRKKSDVLKDLPDKIHSFVPLTLSNWDEYNSIENDVLGYLKEKRGQEAADRASNAEVVVQIENLKQAAVRGKLNSAITWIKDFLESGEKLVVFATHKFVIERLIQEFNGIAVKIDGGVSLEERNKAVDHFQNNPKIKLFVGNIKAAGVGLTLTAASNVVILEFPWTPGDLKQAEDRCHRIGQKDTVNVHFLMVENTIEEKIAQLLDKKTQVLDAVLDGKQTPTGSLLSELIRSLV